jgi:hypothetical protein
MTREESARNAGGRRRRMLPCGHEQVAGPATKMCDECKKTPVALGIRGATGVQIDGKWYIVEFTIKPA